MSVLGSGTAAATSSPFIKWPFTLETVRTLRGLIPSEVKLNTPVASPPAGLVPEVLATVAPSTSPLPVSKSTSMVALPPPLFISW